METSQTKKQVNKKKILFGCLSAVGALALIGGGVGIGYAIFFKKQVATPSLETTTSKLTLSSPGDEITFNISWSNFKVKDNIVIYFERDENIAQYFEPDKEDHKSMLSIETPSGWGVSNDDYVFTIASTKGATTIKIKQNKKSSESQMETILPFKVSAVGWSWNDSIIRELSCCLINPLASSLIDRLEVRNETIRTTDINSSSYNLADLKTYLPSKFNDLPLTTNNKIKFSDGTTDGEVLSALHVYDNAESFAALLVADMYLSSNNASYTEDGINIYHVGSNIKDNPEDQAMFDAVFQQFGKLTNGEISNDIFSASKQNFSTDWEITWALQITYHATPPSWTTASNVHGEATALATQSNDVKSVLRVIYGGVVDTWPSTW